MRLTAELIQNSLSYLNPLKERELDLRGHKIPAVENLGVAGVSLPFFFPLVFSAPAYLCVR
ncbi:U2 small nuclear ribonucleo A protein [Rutstroemia sp. NJR-2017a BBW]|nr:U2 small nuclear ribonucleo A protein [Rutstroemia sp. NJR-2017a BBW]